MASPEKKIDFLSVPDGDAIVQRMPELQATTIPAGTFGGRPKRPDEDVKTVGASYRLMARGSLRPNLGGIGDAAPVRMALQARHHGADGQPDEGTGFREHGRRHQRPAAEPPRRSGLFRARAADAVRALRGLHLPARLLRRHPRLGRSPGSASASPASGASASTSCSTACSTSCKRGSRGQGQGRTSTGSCAETDDLVADVVHQARERYIDNRTVSALILAIDAVHAAVSTMTAGPSGPRRPRAARRREAPAQDAVALAAGACGGIGSPVPISTGRSPVARTPPRC